MTKHIGLIAAASTTYNLARRFAERVSVSSPA